MKVPTMCYRMYVSLFISKTVFIPQILKHSISICLTYLLNIISIKICIGRNSLVVDSQVTKYSLQINLPVSLIDVTAMSMFNVHVHVYVHVHYQPFIKAYLQEIVV